MILLVDAGNTRLKWRLVSASCVVTEGAAIWADSFSALSRDLATRAVTIERILIASVRSGEDNDKLTALFARTYQCKPEFAVSQLSQLGLMNGYEQPGCLGVDRWLMMLAAWHVYPGPSVVVSAGTALTVDMINGSGVHLGGYISPSAHGFAAALNRTAAALDVNVQQPGLAPGRSTEMAVANAYGLMVQQLVLSAMASVGEGARLLLAGGDNVVIAPLFSAACLHNHLVFAGLELYFELGVGHEKGKIPCA